MKNSVAQKWAQQTLEREKAEAVVRAEHLASAKNANALGSKKLSALADEINTLDARLDPENLGEIQLLQAKREQLERLKIKFAADAKARLDAVENQVANDPRLPAVTVDYSIYQIIADAETEMRASFRKYFRHESMAERVFNDCDAGAIFRRWNTYPVSESERLEIIRATARGENLPWIFS